MTVSKIPGKIRGSTRGVSEETGGEFCRTRINSRNRTTNPTQANSWRPTRRTFLPSSGIGRTSTRSGTDPATSLAFFRPAQQMPVAFGDVVPAKLLPSYTLSAARAGTHEGRSLQAFLDALRRP